MADSVGPPPARPAEDHEPASTAQDSLQFLAYPLKPELYVQPERLMYLAAGLEADAMDIAGSPAMGLGLGGVIRQDIESDEYGADAYRLDRPARCFVHIVNAEQWNAITGEPMPTEPISPEMYAQHGIPWFDYSAAGPKAPGADALAALRSVAEIEAARGRPFDEEEIPIDRVIRIPAAPAARGRRPDEVGDGDW